MRNLILSISFLFIGAVATAQAKYDVLWKKVETLRNDRGLTKSALETVNSIYNMAKKEKQQDQMLKALITKASLEQNFDQDGDAAILTLQKELVSSTGAVKSILQSLLAESYLNYYRSRRYQLMNRTAVDGNATADVKTWSVEDFHREISKQYLASLEAEKLLKETRLEDFNAVILKGNARFLRPALYDLLAHRAVDYFQDEEQDVVKPAYSFRVDQTEYLMPAAEFLKMKIKSNDSLSVHHKAFVILQKLMEFHKDDAKQDAFVDVDIRRLKLAQQFAVVAKKDESYVTALETIGKGYPKVAAAGRALLALAEYFVNEAVGYETRQADFQSDTTGRYGYIKAEDLCKRILSQTGEQFSKSGAETLLQQIRRKRLHLETEQVNLPGLPFLSSVSFRNLDRIYLRIVTISDSVLEKALVNSEAEYWKTLTALRPLKTWQQMLPSTDDRQQHRTEIKIDALPFGSYYLLASGTENFESSGVIAAQQTDVSAIGVVQDGFDYFVVNRQSGSPLSKVKAQILFQQYDATIRMARQTRGPVFQSDANGHFHYVNSDRTGRTGGMELVSGKDRLTIKYNVRPYYRSNDEISSDDDKRNSQFHFFTDRAIYRPGQTIYFKGLLIHRTEKETGARLITGKKTTIQLFDNNGQVVESLQVETNDYGSVSGKFLIPTSRLTGSYRIQASNYAGQSYFSVEEYKRPKFNVAIAAPTGNYRLNDTIKVMGKVIAFAGNNITNSTIKYRVVRNTNFIFGGYGKRFLPQKEMEVANGILKTDDTGGFQITFRATADRDSDESFRYDISADVTDLNGETQSGATSLNISRRAVELKLGLTSEQSITLAELSRLQVSTTNAGGIFQQSDIKLSFVSLTAPARLIRKRYWKRPDVFIMSRENFLSSFPKDEYDRETDPTTWPAGTTVYSHSGSTQPDGTVTIDTTKISTGWYRLIAVTHDRYGTEIRDSVNVQILGSVPPTAPAYLIKRHAARPLQPGMSFVESFGSSATDVYLFQHFDYKRANFYGQDSSSVEYSITRLNAEEKSFSYPITEKERGGFGIERFFVKDNRVFTDNTVVQVPWTNKELNISYSTFRDKTLPGSQERWKVKISGDKKDIVAAEMLGSMYDASLDEFVGNRWNVPDVWHVYATGRADLILSGFGKDDSRDKWGNELNAAQVSPVYDQMYSPAGLQSFRLGGNAYTMAPAPSAMSSLEEVVVGSSVKRRELKSKAGDKLSLEPGLNSKQADTATFSADLPQSAQTPAKARSNFNETAFFLPELHTDAEGNIEFSFTMPEALTKWKLQLFAHTKDLKFGYSSREIITQKDLMVQPNAMRFLREGDRLELSTKIVNVGTKEITGIAQLELFDAVTMAPVDGWYQNVNPKQYFTVAAGASSETSFPVQVPFDYGKAVLYRITAKSTSLPQEISDGEEAILPVLTNSILVTESMPLQLETGESKTFKFDKLLKSGSSETLKQQGLTVEFTTNPSWFAVRALPSLAEKSFECSERVFNQFYANALAVSIANSSPRIRQVIEKWTSNKNLVSPLQKNEELKSVMLQETPWLLEGLNDSVQQQNISRLFEAAIVEPAQASTLQKLAQFQTSNGGFSWFQGGPDDRFITQYIVSGMGHLQKLGAIKPAMDDNLLPVLNNAVKYLDKRIEEEYAALLKNKADLKSNHLSYYASQYLYARSFFPKQPVAADAKTAFAYYLTQSAKFWVNQTRLTQGMIALALSRNQQTTAANAILKSLKQNAIRNPELGAYWKDVRAGYFWYQAPVETQSLIIEAFTEISKDYDFVYELRTWLLKNKQTNHWASSKATAEACYALLLWSGDWLSSEPVATIKLGDKTIDNSKTEAGSGYFREAISGDAVKPSMGNIQVSVKSNSNAQTKMPSPVWGAVYWQYFEKSEKISVAGNAVQMSKKLFIEKNSDRGPVLVPVQDGGEIKVGDKVRVRVELRADRDLEYVQLKDMRASGFEPLNVLSGYKWQGGLGYYEATGDASTNFFFDHLTRGTHVFEYSLYAAQKGNFSNGITTVLCLYAPEFTSHSEGIRVNIE